jgi:glutaminase
MTDLSRIVAEIADYIPPLAAIDLARFGMAVIEADGTCHLAGDAEEPFSIQSVAKVFGLTLALALGLGLGLAGDALWRRVGREPSGTAFNSIVQLETERGIPRNPFINADAIAVSDIILSGHQRARRSARSYASSARWWARRISISTRGSPRRSSARATATSRWPTPCARSAISTIQSTWCWAPTSTNARWR